MSAAEFGVVAEAICKEDEYATGTLDNAREASTSAAMSFCFIPSRLLRCQLGSDRPEVCDCRHSPE